MLIVRRLERPRLARLAVLVIACAAIACSIGETTHVTEIEPTIAVALTKTCDSPFTKPDLSTLTACGDGKGHCYDGTKIGVSGFQACTGADVCIPDKVLEANGDKLKACTFFLGNKPGACASTAIPQIASHAGQLQKDVCDDDERCAPCVDPTDGSDTHLCEAAGVHEKSCTGGAGTAPIPCCHGAGVCLNLTAVPEGQRGDVNQDECPSQKVCAPASLVSGQPKSCSALGLTGVCLDVCFAGMLQPAGPVIRGECQASEVCLPCVVGSSEGVPGC